MLNVRGDEEVVYQVHPSFLSARGLKSAGAKVLRVVDDASMAASAAVPDAGEGRAEDELVQELTGTLKSGEERSKVVYKEAAECTEWLLAKIEKAKSPQEVLELLTEAMIAAEYADQDAVAMSNRVHWRCSSREVLEEVEAEAKQVGCKGKGRSRSSYGF